MIPICRAHCGGVAPPISSRAVEIPATDIDDGMDAGRPVFVIEIPPRFEADVLAGRQPSVQINVDATAMTQAGNGSRPISRASSRTRSQHFSAGREGQAQRSPVNVVVHAKFNPNLEVELVHLGDAQVINHITCSR